MKNVLKVTFINLCELTLFGLISLKCTLDNYNSQFALYSISFVCLCKKLMNGTPFSKRNML